MYISGELDINRKSIKDINNTLNIHKFTEQNGSYDYLISMSISSLSQEKIDSLNETYDKTEQELKFYEKTEAKALWKIDLNNFFKKIKE